MNETEFRSMLENLNWEIQSADPDDDSLRTRLGKAGARGALGDRIRLFLDGVRERGTSGRDKLVEDLIETETAVGERYPRLAANIRAAINIIENAGV